MRRLLCCLALVVAGVSGCGEPDPDPRHETTGPTSSAPSVAPIRLDPCDAVSRDGLAEMGLELQKPNTYVSLFGGIGLRFRGCLIGVAADPLSEFYLQATNMTMSYLEQDRAQNYSFEHPTIGGRPAALAKNKEYSGTCLLLVEMNDYGLLIDGRARGDSCEWAVDAANRIVPALQGK